MTARKRSTLSQLRRALYLTERGIGDVQAAERSPGTYAKRRGRRRATRAVFQLFNEALRGPWSHVRPCPGVMGWGRFASGPFGTGRCDSPQAQP